MRYWEKNSTEGMIDKRYLYDRKFKKPDPPKLEAGEDYIDKRFCIVIGNILIDVPNFTLSGFKI